MTAKHKEDGCEVVNAALLYKALREAGVVLPPAATEIVITIREGEAPVIESRAFVCVKSAMLIAERREAP